MTQNRAARRQVVTPYGGAYDNETPTPGFFPDCRWLVAALILAIVVDVGCLYALALAVGAL